MKVIKRNGSIESFQAEKITHAIEQACIGADQHITQEELHNLTYKVVAQCGEITEIECIQDWVESALTQSYPEVAKKYITYRETHRKWRENYKEIKQQIDELIEIQQSDISHENANISSQTPAGQMMNIASINSKDYALNYLLAPEHADLHKQGYIHIHDLDYYLTKTTTCIQYDLATLFTGGFLTKNGTIKEPKSIETYATLATIVFQTNQNEQHGGQSIPAFDFFMAPGVLKSFRKNLIRSIKEYYYFHETPLPSSIDSLIETTVQGLENIDIMAIQKEVSVNIEKCITHAKELTEQQTYQAMQGFIFNLNTMHSRGGNQVVFSSINYGTDTSPEGRMVIRNILEVTKKGLGHGEVAIFPIQIFKVKEGVNFSKDDMSRAYMEPVWDNKFLNSTFEAENFDLFLLSIQTTAQALFPNYQFLDTPFNKSTQWREGDPLRYKHEVATMGCRTRVFENVQGERTSLGRGNLSFTSINLVRLAIEAAQTSKDMEKRKELFEQKFMSMIDSVVDQLRRRLTFQKTALAMQFPFMMQNDIWQGGSQKKGSDQVGEILEQGTLGVGFIGAHNGMVALFGKGHSKDSEVNDYLYGVLSKAKERIDWYKEKEQRNYALLGTPAEGLSGRFTKIDKQTFGTIEGVNDREYYINSFHVDVQDHINAFDKIRIEAPYHALTLGGHITYVELDGEAKKNYHAIAKIVEHMYNSHIGYGSINHPVDQCGDCYNQSIMYEACPICGSQNIKRIRRITGYLTGTLDSWNRSKKAEEKDRVKHI